MKIPGKQSWDSNHTVPRFSGFILIGFSEFGEIKQIFIQDYFDDLSLLLLQDKEPANNAIEHDNCLFIALKVLIAEDKNLKSEPMIFIVS